MRFVGTSRLSLILFLDFSRSRWNGTTWTNFCGIMALSRSTLPIQCKTRTFLVRGWHFFPSKVKTVYLLKKKTISLSLKNLAVGSKRVPAYLLNTSFCETFQIWFCWTKSLPLRCGLRWRRCWPTLRDARHSSRSSSSPTTSSSESNVRAVTGFYFCVANGFKIKQWTTTEIHRFYCTRIHLPTLVGSCEVLEVINWLMNHCRFLND